MRSVFSSYGEAFRGLPREVWILALVSLVNRSGSMVLFFLLLYLTTRLGYEPSGAGIVLALYGVGSMIGIALGGRLTDRVGFRAVQLASLTLSGLTLFILGFLEDRVAIAATVFVLGLVTEGFRPANLAGVAEYTDASNRSRGYGLNRLALNAGWTIGPAVGGVLAMTDYQLLFWVDGATCLAAALVVKRGLARPRRRTAEERTEVEAQPAASPWRDGWFVAALALVFFQGVIFFQLLSTFPLFLRRDLGFAEAVVGRLSAINTVIIILFEMQLIRAVEKRDPLRLCGLAALFVGFGYGLLGYVSTLPLVILTVVLWTVGEMLFSPMLTTWVAGRAEERNRGRYMGAYGMCFSFCTVVAPLAGTAVYQHFGPDVLWDSCIALGVLDCVGFLVLARAIRKRH